jgi:hypothetical protein
VAWLTYLTFPWNHLMRDRRPEVVVILACSAVDTISIMLEKIGGSLDAVPPSAHLYTASGMGALLMPNRWAGAAIKV